jgi:hypothetical protein
MLVLEHLITLSLNKKRIFMTKEYLLKRIDELGKAVTESAENHQRLKVMIDNATNSHNALVGRLEEARDTYKQLCEKEEVGEVKHVVVGESVPE